MDENELKVKVEGIQEEDVKRPSQQEIDEQVKMVQLELATIREHRVKLDGLAHITKTLPGQSIEKINAYNKIMQARAWLREALEYAGEPILNQKLLNKISDIEEDDDRSDPIKVQLIKKEPNKPDVLTDANDVQSLCHVKLELGNMVNQLGILSLLTETLYETIIFGNLREAAFWIDRELFRLKEENKAALYAQTQQGKRQLPKRPEKKKPIIVGGNRSGILGPDGRPLRSFQEMHADKPKVVKMNPEPENRDGLAKKMEEDAVRPEDLKAADIPSAPAAPVVEEEKTENNETNN